MTNLDSLSFDQRGLITVVVQEEISLAVLMVAWANRNALEKTLATGFAHFWSRSRQSLWKKGETSGNVLKTVDVRVDCDADTLLYIVQAKGPACHTGESNCFFRSLSELGKTHD